MEYINTQLCGGEVEINVGDPWEFCEKFGTGPFHARVLNVQEESQSILLEFHKPFKTENKSYKFFSGSIRHHGADLKQVLEGKVVHFAFLSLNEEQIKSSNPFDTRSWRGGGVTFIGSVKLKGKQ